MMNDKAEVIIFANDGILIQDITEHLRVIPSSIPLILREPTDEELTKIKQAVFNTRATLNKHAIHY